MSSKCKKCGYDHNKEEPCIDRAEIEHRNKIFSTRNEIQILQKRVGQFKSCLSYDFSEVIQIQRFIDKESVHLGLIYLSDDDKNEHSNMIEKLFNQNQKLYTTIVKEVISDMERKIERLSINLAGLKEGK